MVNYSYKVFEKNHRFVRREGTVYRENEIWRKLATRLIGDHVRDELVKKNCVKILYEPSEIEET